MPVTIERQGAVAILTLSRPERRNAWGADFQTDLTRHLAELEQDESVLCVVLTGDESGQAFSAGADLKESTTHAAPTAGDFVRSLPRLKDFVGNLLADFPKPTIAAVNGYAIGVGVLITLSCDLIVASDKAEWRMPQASLGILPSYGSCARLSRWIGKGLVMRAALGFPIKAEEAYRIGLAQWLVPHDKLMQQTMEVAQHIAGLPPLATRLIKEAVNRGIEIGNVAEASLVDLYRLMILESSADSAEAHAAWRERRPPDFSGN